MPVSKYAKKQPSRREYYYEDEEEPLPSPRFPKLKPREHEDDDTVLGTPRRIGEQLEVRARLPAAAAAAALHPPTHTHLSLLSRPLATCAMPARAGAPRSCRCSRGTG